MLLRVDRGGRVAHVAPAAPPAPDDRRRVGQVLVELVAEEALAQLGQPVLSALQGAHELLPPVAQQDVVVRPLADEGLVVVDPPSRSRKTLALWLPSSRSSGPLSEAALLLEICSLLFVKKRSSEKSEVLVTVSVLDAKSCGAETVPELVTSPHTTLPVDAPPLVAVKVQSRLSQSISVAPVTAPVAAKLAAVAAPVDTSPTVVKFPALAVLLIVNVLPVIPVAELSRPTLAVSKLPDTAPVDDSAGADKEPLDAAVLDHEPEEPRLPGDCRQHGQRGLQHELHGLVGQPSLFLLHCLLITGFWLLIFNIQRYYW